MSESVSLVGTDSSAWDEVAEWLPMALEQLGHPDLTIGAVNPPPGYSGDISAALGHLSHLQQFASDVATNERTGFPHLLRLTGSPAFYLPASFREPLLRLRKPSLLGRLFPVRLFVGSSVALLNELNALASLLHVTKDAGDLGIEAFEKVTGRGALPAERYTWGVLRWFCRMSVEQHAVMELG